MEEHILSMCQEESHSRVINLTMLMGALEVTSQRYRIVEVIYAVQW